ncbi:hypothetical protein GJ496_009687 [Pomphorhynchus laevis]|nr:hypothetical protein GJ496_009687 [Pomphorhynchus laevis]
MSVPWKPLLICVLLLSIWSIIQNLLIGVSFWFICANMEEDVKFNAAEPNNSEQFYSLLVAAYKSTAKSSWIATCLSGATFIASALGLTIIK